MTILSYNPESRKAMSVEFSHVKRLQFRMIACFRRLSLIQTTFKRSGKCRENYAETNAKTLLERLFDSINICTVTFGVLT
jgi:hypothetical protein